MMIGKSSLVSVKTAFMQPCVSVINLQYYLLEALDNPSSIETCDWLD